LDILGIIGIVLSLAIAWWEHHKAKKAEVQFNKAVDELPSKLIADLSRMIAPPSEKASQSADSDGPTGLTTRYADLNGDGTPELLVEYISGPHSSALQVFGLQLWDFKLIAELFIDTPFGFDLEDIDGDGVLEVSVVETARDTGLPYVMGLRDRVGYKLVDGEFKEISRVRGYTDEDLAERLSEINDPTISAR
jgi:hypothetical protein